MLLKVPEKRLTELFGKFGDMAGSLAGGNLMAMRRFGVEAMMQASPTCRALRRPPQARTPYQRLRRRGAGTHPQGFRTRNRRPSSERSSLSPGSPIPPGSPDRSAAG